jgi:hypothetical protein
MSFCRFMTCQIVFGSDPSGFQIWAANTTEFFRGLSSNTASTGVLDRMPSRYRSPSIRIGGKAGADRADKSL